MLTRIDDIGCVGAVGRRVGRGRTAEPVHGELLLGVECPAAPDGTCRNRAALPRELFDKMVAAKNFQSGLGTLRQVEMGLFDMRHPAEPGADQRVQHVLDEVRREVGVLSPPPFDPSSSTASGTYFPAVTRPATTATSGPRCFRPMPGVLSRKPVPCAWPPAGDCVKKFSKQAAAARHWRTARQ